MTTNTVDPWGTSIRGNTTVVHLNLDGDIIAVQLDALDKSLTANYPIWIQERIAIMKMGEEGVTYKAFGGYKLNKLFFIMVLTKKETKELNKLIGEQYGTNARKESKAKGSENSR